MLARAELSPSFSSAVRALKRGGFVLLHDVSSRENETDMVAAAQFVTPDHIRRLREEAGGLICQAVSNEVAKVLGLPFLVDVYRFAGKRYGLLSDLANGVAPYGDRPAFSITVNHRSTYTGITDQDRATTVRELSKLCKMVTTGQKAEDGGDDDKARELLGSEFRSPGHLHILIASNGLISGRRGHTELSVYLAKIAELIPTTVICEMLDSRTHRALSSSSAKQYAERNEIPFVEGSELIAYFQSRSKKKSSRR